MASEMLRGVLLAPTVAIGGCLYGWKALARLRQLRLERRARTHPVASRPPIEVEAARATRRIVAAGAGAVVALTTFDADQLVADVLRAGAVGFLLKDVTAQGLADAVGRAEAGEPVGAPRPGNRWSRPPCWPA